MFKNRNDQSTQSIDPSGHAFAGILVILGNLKLTLFYIGILPEFFAVAALQLIDIAVIGGLIFIS